MNERLKHRMVGALVLVALAVVFIPMVLQPPFEGDAPASSPGAPPALLGTVDADRHSIERYAREAVIARDGSSPDYALESPASSSTKAPRTPLKGAGSLLGSVKNSSAISPSKDIGVTKQEDDQLVPDTEDTEYVAISGRALGTPSGWVVQLGSFAKQSNAVTLRDRLRAMGYGAFVKPVATTAGMRARVYVGPELPKEEASQLSRKLGVEVKLRGLVVPFP